MWYKQSMRAVVCADDVSGYKLTRAEMYPMTDGDARSRAPHGSDNGPDAILTTKSLVEIHDENAGLRSS